MSDSLEFDFDVDAAWMQFQRTLGEYVSAIITMPQFEPDHYMVMATRGGMIKKTSLAEYAKIRANGLIAINLVDGDELRWVGMTDGQSDVILATRKGQAARFHEHEVRAMGRDTRGVTGIAAPIFDRRNNVLGSLSITIGADHVSDARSAEIAERIIGGAQIITRTIARNETPPVEAPRPAPGRRPDLAGV